MRYNDLHVHTKASPDADVSARELCRLAADRGIGTIGFVAHLDLHPKDYCYGGFCEAEYLSDIDQAESSGADVLRGLEVGEPHRFMKEAEKMFNRGSYDFITGALHWTKDAFVLDRKPFLSGDPREIIEQYYRETLTIVETAPVNILAHMGIYRRGMAQAGLATDFEETELFPDLMRKILETMIKRGIAIEVNTAGLRRPENTTYPAACILRMFAKLGGSRVTLGSDTHTLGNAFFGLSAGYSLLISCGFREYGVFLKGEYLSSPLHCPSV
jgi:histidinol-phosphatase (PHP family)